MPAGSDSRERPPRVVDASAATSPGTSGVTFGVTAGAVSGAASGAVSGAASGAASSVSGAPSPTVSAVQEAPRWCARLGFSRDLWTGRARVVCDPEVEASLRDTRRLSGAAAGLLAELLPERASTVWLLAQRPDELAGPRRRGVHSLEEFDGLLTQAPWEVAIVDLGQFLVDTANLSRFAARARGRLENRLDTRAFRLLSAAGEGAYAGRTVIVSVPAQSRGGLSLSDFQDLLEQHFARARVYALAPVAVAVVVDCGEVVREDEDEGDAGEDEDDRAPPLGFDNRLGEDLGYDTYLALVNAPAEPEGVTLVELPAAALLATRSSEVSRPNAAARPQEARRSERGEAELENLKIQLGQARRQVELAAIARQSLVEQLDAAQARVDSLEDQVAEQQRRQSASEVNDRRVAALAAAPTGEQVHAEPPTDLRPDATQATLLALRWELEQTREELRKALGRPVDALERELAELRARLGVPTPAD